MAFWKCDDCGAQNHESDAECQFCDKHEHYTRSEDYDAGAPEGPQKCSRCGEMYPFGVESPRGPVRIEVTEVKGVVPPPEARLYEFTVTALFRHEDIQQPGPHGGFYVEARGPRGSVMATVFGDDTVTAETVIGAKFWRS